MTRPHTQSAAASLPSPAATIVVVDDDPSLVETLHDLLTVEGYRVEGFTDPFEALARLRLGPLPDLAIFDCIMPGLTGAELCPALTEAGVEVPVLLMTALADPSFCVHREDVTVLNKPFLIEDLLVEMETRLRPSSSARRLRLRGDARV
jgi:DNA-binding response OmpR family regulator